MKIYIINGPNLNMLGIREPDQYGKSTYDDLLALLNEHAKARGVEIVTYQSNHEGAIVDKIQAAYENVDGIVINPAAYTHTSVAILDALNKGKIADVVVDCWENEPDVSDELLKRAIVATPHIAGYSREGKIRATAMVVKALTKHFGLPDISLSETVPAGAAEHVSFETIENSYSPKEDTIALKEDKYSFEQLRNTYNYRSEVKNIILE